MNILILCGPPVSKIGENVGGLHAVVACINAELTKMGHHVTVLTKEIFEKMPPNTSKYDYLAQVLDNLQFDHVHIVAQELFGLLALRYCVSRKLAFTTAYHTQIPEYMEVRWGIPAKLAYAYMRWFLNAASCVIVPTPTMAAELRNYGVKNVVSCLHGVDTERFKPRSKEFLKFPRPIWLYVSRVTEEKSPGDFLALDLPGTKVVVGDGYLRPTLQQQYPNAHFAGVQKGDELAKYFAAADCFVFPSKTETFGLVMLEALASGIPVAAYPVTGPRDVITDPKVGCLNADLAVAAKSALKLSSTDCRKFALQHSWTESARQFLALQVPYRPAGTTPRAPVSLSSFDQELLTFLEGLVDWTEQRLFADEPSGPYAKAKKA